MAGGHELETNRHGRLCWPVLFSAFLPGSKSSSIGVPDNQPRGAPMISNSITTCSLITMPEPGGCIRSCVSHLGGRDMEIGWSGLVLLKSGGHWGPDESCRDWIAPTFDIGFDKRL